MERWSSRLGFVLASVGAAVGIGNLWRFPAVVGRNGGGAYLVPYLVSFFVFALPLVVLEVDVGRSKRSDVVTAFRAVDRRFAVIGWLVTATVVLLLSYYLVITGWVLGFVVVALRGLDTTFASFTSSYRPVVYFAVSGLVTGTVVSFGVKKGIERTATVLIPLSFAVLVVLVAFSATLDGFADGARFFLTPDFSVLSDPLVWGEAFGQAFFSLSAGMGILLTYGSYLDDETSVTETSAVIAVADFSVALLSGLVVFPIVFTFGLEPSMGAELAFTTLPRAFSAMPYGNAVAVAFFGLLFFAALTSAISMVEAATAAVETNTRVSRRKAAAGVTASALVLGLPSVLSYTALEFSVLGTRFLDAVDLTVGTVGLLVTGFVIAVVFTWFDTPEAPRPVVAVVRYVLPVLLVALVGVRLLPAFVDVWSYLPHAVTLI